MSIRSTSFKEGKIPTGTIIEVLLWINFVGGYTWYFLWAFPAIRFLYYLTVHGTGVLLIIISFKYINYFKTYAKLNFAYLFLLPMSLICFLGTILGIFRGASLEMGLFNSLLPYAGAFLILLPAHEYNRERILVVFRQQFVLCVLFSLMVIPYALSSGILSRDEWFLSVEIIALQSLFLLPFFAGFCLVKKNWKLTFITVLGYGMWILYSTRGMMRNLFILGILVIPIAIFLLIWKDKSIIGQINFLFKFLLIICLFIVSFSVYRPDVVSQFQNRNAFSGILRRLTGNEEWSGDASEMIIRLKNQIDDEIENSRGAEALDFINNLSLIDYLAGKGFGTSWPSSLYGENRYMIHIGPLHLIFKGGIPLLITYYVFFLSALVSSFRNSLRDPVAMGCFVFLCVNAVSFISYGAQTSNYGTYVTWIIFGLALSTDKVRRLKGFSW